MKMVTKMRWLLVAVMSVILASPSAFAHKSGPITYQHYSRALRNDVCQVLMCDKNVTGRIEVPYNVSRDLGNWVVESIALGAFQECRMTEVQLSGAIRTIGGQAFYNCPNLKLVELKEGLKFIETGAFSYCQKLDSINLPQSLKYIGDNAFYGCLSLRTIRLGRHMEHLGQQAFFGCRSLTTVEANAPITKVQTSAFGECSSLTTITLPSVRIICSYAFERSGLRSIYIGPHIRTIEFSAFASCNNLTDVYIYSTKPPTARGAFSYGATKRMTLYVPAGSENAYRNHPDWKDFGKIIPFITK